jgi:hypothetical protein
MKWVGTWLLLCAVALGTDVVTLAWDESPEPTVVGYRVFAGTNSRAYFVVTNIAGRAQVTNEITVPFPAFWYFAVTATNAAGLESDFSAEVGYCFALEPPEVLAEPYVRLVPTAERSTNLLTWEAFPLEPTLVPATNAQEFFRVTGVEIEPVRMVK